MYGFPFDPRLWVCFFVHDLGYWGKPNMDGKEGERHVLFGADLVGRLFDWYQCRPFTGKPRRWNSLCVYHSRYWAAIHKVQPSRLCFADKLAFILYPRWLALFLYTLTGEWKEYYEAHKHEVKYDPQAKVTMTLWYDESVEYVAKWIEEFMSGDKEDTWTKAKPTS